MKVLFQTRFDVFEKRGGDTIQITKTAEELRKLGVEVDINNSLYVDASLYDLVHIFQLQWVCEPYLQALNAKKYNKPLVLSPIHHSEKEVLRFEDQARYNYRRIVNIFIKSQEHRDVLKNIYRSFFDRRKLYPTFLSVIQGYRNQQRKVLQMSDMVLTQTEREAKVIEEDYKTQIKWTKIVNGVGEVFFKDSYEKPLDFENYIVTVGRIEPRKNQLKIIKAVEHLNAEENMNLKLVIIGELNKNNHEYYHRFKNEIKNKPWITYIPSVPYEKIPSIYRFAKVCVSASWFETSGLTLLEAVISKCNVVATGEVIKEYLGDIALYADPNDVDSLKEAIKKAYAAPRPKLPEDLKKTYTWSNVAKETLKVYNSILEK